ncbi:MAG: PD-(D/E)XK nuclease family protein [PVC group bacterium]
MSRLSERKGSSKISNPFRWSKSRAGIFAECKRKYYLRYYRHWGGWQDDAPEIARLAYRLGKMTSMAALAGSAVHEVLAGHFRGLRNGQFRELVPERAVEIMRAAWINAKKERWRLDPKKYPPLFEVYYDRVPSDERLREYADGARRAVVAARESPLGGLAGSLGRSDFLWIDPAGEAFSEEICFDVPPYQAMAAPDLVLRDKNRVLIVDWKTGRESDGDRLQMEAGALWAAQRLKEDGKELWAALAYLKSGLIKEFPVSGDDLCRAEQSIRGNMEAMSRYLEDPAQNIPLAQESFPVHNSDKLCRYCDFQEICFNPVYS